MAIGQYALGFIGTLISWFLMSHIGRRALYFWGLCLLSCFLLVIGGLGVISQDNVGAAWALGSVLLVYTLVYNCTVGPVCYALVSEIPSTRAKVKTVVLARNVYNLVSSSLGLCTSRADRTTLRVASLITSLYHACFRQPIGTGLAKAASSLLD